MKKLIALLLAMVLVVGLCACGEKKEEKKSPADQAQDIVNDALENVDVDVDMGAAMEGPDDNALAELEDALAGLEDIDFDAIGG